jgi:hypothetical protein
MKYSMVQSRKTMETSSGKHLYKFGLIGLVPLFGFFSGLYFLVLGVAKYRNRWLAFIGLGGMLFSVTLYGGLFYYGFFSDAGRRSFGEINKTIMNSLVSEIELYKLKHGTYPDSLEELQARNKIVFIYDAISDGFSENSRKLIYQKMDKGYLLYSAGLDFQPKTADDIYPTIDTAGIGLLMSRPELQTNSR